MIVINNKEEYNNLISQINILDEAYYNDKPLVSDKKYDELYFAIKDFEERTGVLSQFSPTQKVRYTVLSSLSKATHSHWMGSADKTKDIEDIKKFCTPYDYITMLKLDGLSVCLTYEDGKLVKAETRGDGYIGEDVTHNALVIKNIPKYIKYKHSLTVDGEVICSYKNFKNFDTEYKNPRNFASGSIRLLDSTESAKRNLKFIAWETDYSLGRLSEKLTWLKDNGFSTVPWIYDHINIETTIKNLQFIATELDIPIDGLIFKYDDVNTFNEQGKTSHHYKGMLALKFYDEEVQTELRDIVWQLGRRGVLTPVAVFAPIEIDGTTVNRASLHNLSILNEKLGTEPHFGQVVYVSKRNQIIPQIERANIFGVYTDDDLFFIPNVCPVCGGNVEIIESDSGVKELYCQNPDCSGKKNKKIEHFCSKKGLDIKGVSEKTIEFLYNRGWLDDITDLFKLRDFYSEWIIEKGWGKASVDKIIMSIDNAKECELYKFISALGIPLIGEVEAKSIAKNINNNYDKLRNLLNKNYGYAFEVINNWDGFGPVKTESILKFNWKYADKIAEYLTFKEVAEAPASASLKGEVICITGSLKTCKNRDELKNIIESCGGKVSSSVSNKTTLLVNNDINSTSAKNLKAKELGIPIITEEELLSRTK